MAKQAFEESIAKQIDSHSLKLRYVVYEKGFSYNTKLEMYEEGFPLTCSCCGGMRTTCTWKTNKLCHPLAFLSSDQIPFILCSAKSWSLRSLDE
ncbi:hypothetical protein C2S51_003581 [Perilla frutescens var. frutescens]|nr:hypothetical protein C2S51_003581 [Perilla frutescens var. frutescens]